MVTYSFQVWIFNSTAKSRLLALGLDKFKRKGPGLGGLITYVGGGGVGLLRDIKKKWADKI